MSLCHRKNMFFYEKKDSRGFSVRKHSRVPEIDANVTLLPQFSNLWYVECAFSFVPKHPLRHSFYSSSGNSSYFVYLLHFLGYPYNLIDQLGYACALLTVKQELRTRPVPVIFAAFSGGTKSCMYKVFQIIDGKYEGLLDPDAIQLVNDSICGQIYDSGPVDFTSDLATRIILHPNAVRASEPQKAVSWMAKMVTSGLDTLFLSRFEAQRADYWQTLYSSVKWGPILILSSEDDELVPCRILCNFAQYLRADDGDVKLVLWKSSPHLGHFDHHPDEYKTLVFDLLSKASIFHSQKVHLSSADQITESIFDLHKAAACSNESFRRVATRPSDHFFLPSSMGYLESKEGSSSMQEEQKEGFFHLQNPPSTNPNGVLGQMLFDVCVPKNIEEWDIRPVGQMGSKLPRRPGPFNPVKCIRRCRM